MKEENSETKEEWECKKIVKHGKIETEELRMGGNGESE